MCCRERHTTTTIPFGSLLLSYFGVFGCQENPTFLLFSKLFSMDILEKKMGWLFPSFISQFLIYLGLDKNSISSCVDSRRGWDQVWCGLQVCSSRRRWEAESGRYWSSGPRRIGRLELSKTLYSVFILYSGCFLSIVGLWFLISSEVFHVKIVC